MTHSWTWSVGLVLCALQSGAPVQSAPPASDHLAWWREARLGLFVHWGPVSLAGTEIGWSRGREVPIERYDQLYKSFDPQRFDAAQWVSTAKEAGLRYVVLTTKHHDGFSLYDTQQSEYSVMHTPYARDVTSALASECARQGLRFGAYYSIIDWYHPDYLPRGAGDERPEAQADFERYVAFAKAQLRELLTGYPNVDLLWFDGQWEPHWSFARGRDLEAYCRALRPGVIINNRVAQSGGEGTEPAGDYDTPEKTVGAYRDDRAWETCDTLAQQWAWKPDDELKSLDELLRLVARVVGGDGNLLLNVGPMPDGGIEPRQVERLKQLGAWLSRNGESIYGTRGGPFLPRGELTSTRKGSTIYLHVLEWPREGLVIPPFEGRILSARRVDGGKLQSEPGQAGLRLQVAQGERGAADTVVALELDSPAMTLVPRQLRLPGDAASFARPATASNVYRGAAQWGPDKALDADEATRWATDEEAHQPWLEVDLGGTVELGRAVLRVPQEYAGRIRAFEVRCQLDGQWTTACRGEKPGAQWEQTFGPLRAQRVRLVVTESAGGPTVSTFEVFPPGSNR